MARPRPLHGTWDGWASGLPGPMLRAMPALLRAVRRFVHARSEDPERLLSWAMLGLAFLVTLPAGPARLLDVLVVSVVYRTGAELMARFMRRSMSRLLQLFAAVAYVAVLATTTPGPWPTAPNLLYLPLLAYAAAMSTRAGLLVGVGSAIGFVVPAGFGTPISTSLAQEWLGMVAVGFVLAFGTRRTVTALEQALRRTRVTLERDRRLSRQLAAVETIGARLAGEGPRPEVLEDIVGILASRFGYRFVSLYLGDERRVRLAAQRGYPEPILEFAASTGVVGRVMRTREPAFLVDTSHDPDYVAANTAITSEISLPLLADGAFRGVVNVEAAADAPLARSDLATMTLVADRIASALALAERHQEAIERARRYQQLTVVAQELGRTLEPGEVRSRITELVPRVIPHDTTSLVLRGPSGEYRLSRLRGGDQRYAGVRIEPGEGIAGQAIARRGLVVDVIGREQFPLAVRGAAGPDAYLGCAVPLIHGDEVLGALGLSRVDLDRAFTELELEILPILAAQVALALANADLHDQVAQASIRDPLTGLHNRRHLDVALGRLEAARARREASDRPPVAAIIFDLDHFGAINKQYGHHVGDDILRRFGAIVTRWFRASDVVGRYGGEEFLAVLEGASRDEAVTLADGIRREFAATRFELPDGNAIQATVSAGCSGLGPDVESIGALVEVADVALSLAKRAGRDQVVAA